MNGPRPAAPASSPERQLQTDLDGLNLTTDQMLHEVSAFLFEYPIGRQTERTVTPGSTRRLSWAGQALSNQICARICAQDAAGRVETWETHRARPKRPPPVRRGQPPTRDGPRPQRRTSNPEVAGSNPAPATRQSGPPELIWRAVFMGRVARSRLSAGPSVQALYAMRYMRSFANWGQSATQLPGWAIRGGWRKCLPKLGGGGCCAQPPVLAGVKTAGQGRLLARGGK